RKSGVGAAISTAVTINNMAASTVGVSCPIATTTVALITYHGYSIRCVRIIWRQGCDSWMSSLSTITRREVSLVTTLPLQCNFVAIVRLVHFGIRTMLMRHGSTTASN